MRKALIAAFLLVPGLLNATIPTTPRPEHLWHVYSASDLVAIGRVVAVHPYVLADGWSLAQFEAEDCWRGCAGGETFYYAQRFKSGPPPGAVLLLLSRTGRSVGESLEGRSSVSGLAGIDPFQTELLSYALSCRNWLFVDGDDVVVDRQCIMPVPRFKEHLGIVEDSGQGSFILPQDLLIEYFADPLSRHGLFRATEQEVQERIKGLQTQIAECEEQGWDQDVKALRQILKALTTDLDRMQRGPAP